MTIYYINPNYDFYDIIIIMDNLANDIATNINQFNNIVQQKIYNNLLQKIIFIVSNYLKIYKFYSNNITCINVQIYNKNINVVTYIVFSIQKNYFFINSTNWYNFYNGLLNIEPLVFNNLSIQQKEILSYSIINGDFFMINNLNFTYNLQLINAIILKKKNSYNISSISNYIVTLFWY